MKAQISFVEFLVSITIFLSITLYIFFTLQTFIPSYLSALRNERIRSEAFQISELLINDPGQPANWPLGGSAARYGLADETTNSSNFLSSSKISILNSDCSQGYSTVKNKLAVTDFDFAAILVERPSGNLLLNCKPPAIPIRTINVTVRRIVVVNKNPITYGEFILQMW